MKTRGEILKVAKELYDALKLAEMVIQADLNTRNLQRVEREANELILGIMRKAMKLFEQI